MFPIKSVCFCFLPIIVDIAVQSTSVTICNENLYVEITKTVFFFFHFNESQKNWKYSAKLIGCGMPLRCGSLIFSDFNMFVLKNTSVITFECVTVEIGFISKLWFFYPDVIEMEHLFSFWLISVYYYPVLFTTSNPVLFTAFICKSELIPLIQFSQMSQQLMKSVNQFIPVSNLDKCFKWSLLSDDRITDALVLHPL